MLKSSKITGTVQEVILPDFPDDDNTVTTVSKSRRVSFGTNFVKEFIVGSTISGQCMPEYEQAFPSSDSSTADSSQSGVDSDLLEQSRFIPHESHKMHKSGPPSSHQGEGESVEVRPKVPKFSSTVCFSADSPTADMEFTEGCITLAKSILEKKNKEMTVIIQAKPKEPKEDEKGKEEETKYFDGSQFDMSVTRCLKPKGNKREEKRFEGENTRIFTKYENDMSITRCNRIFQEEEWEECKENRMPLDMIMRHLDKDDSDLENDLFNSEKTIGNFLNLGPFDFSHSSEELNLNESMDITTDLPKGSSNVAPNPPTPIDRSSFQHQCNPNSPEEMEVSYPEPSLADVKVVESLILNSEKTLERSPNATPSSHQQLNISPPEEMEISNPETSLIDTESLKEQSKETLESLPNPAVSSPSPVDLSSYQQQVNPNPPEDMEISNPEPSPTDTEVVERLKLNSENTLGGSPNATPNRQSPVDRSTYQQHPSPPVHKEVSDPEPSLADTEVVESVEEQSKGSSYQEVNPSPPEEAEVSNPELSLTDTPTNPITDSTYQQQLHPSPPVHKEVSNPEPSPTDTEVVESLKLSSNTLEGSHSAAPNPSSPVDRNSHQQQLNPSPPEHKEVSNPEPSLAETEVIESLKEQSKRSNYQQQANPSPPEEMEVSNLQPSPEDIKVVESPPILNSEKTLEGSPKTAPNPPSPIDRSSHPHQINISPPEEAEVSIPEPSLADIKVVESLKEQSEEPGCTWSFEDIRHPSNKTRGCLTINFGLLESSAVVNFWLKASEDEHSLDPSSVVVGSEISPKEEKQPRLPEYRLVVEFGFAQLKRYFEQSRAMAETIRHVPYLLDQVNSFMRKTNAHLRQVHTILTSYPGSRLNGSVLSFRLFSFPIFFSSVVSIDLTNTFRLTKSSLSFERDFGSLDENKVREIFEKCLKRENSLCEFVIQSTKYLYDMEKVTGHVSKRGHIRMLPSELKS